jgi:hypothetical protein
VSIGLKEQRKGVLLNKKGDESEVEAKHQRAWRGEHGEGASFLLPEGLGAGRDDPLRNLMYPCTFFPLFLYVIFWI